MDTEARPIVTGATEAHVRVVPVDTVGETVARLMVDAADPAWQVAIIQPPKSGESYCGAAGTGDDPPGAVLIVGSTASAGRLADAVASLVGKRQSREGKLRVWPAFVAGDAANIAGFDSILDGLPSGSTDAVLVLTAAPSPEVAADALLSWVTVKLPAPPSVLGQLPDTQGQICRYVALGLAGIAATDRQHSDSGASGPGGCHEGDVGPQDAKSALAATEPVRTLRSQAEDLCRAAAAADPAAILAAEHALVVTANRNVSAEAWLALADLADSADDLPEGQPVHASAATADLSARAADLVLLASKSGFGRLVSRRRRDAAIAALTAATAALVDVVEGEWNAAANVGLGVAAGRAAQRREEERASRAAADAADRQRRAVSDALADGDTWAPIDAQAINRVWGQGAPAPRRYVIGDRSLIGSVIDLANDADTCLCVSTEDGEDIRILVAQYGLPVAALT